MNTILAERAGRNNKAKHRIMRRQAPRLMLLLQALGTAETNKPEKVAKEIATVSGVGGKDAAKKSTVTDGFTGLTQRSANGSQPPMS
jgi:hypothetical protein